MMVRGSGEGQVRFWWTSGEGQISIWAWHWWTWHWSGRCMWYLLQGLVSTPSPFLCKWPASLVSRWQRSPVLAPASNSPETRAAPPPLLAPTPSSLTASMTRAQAVSTPDRVRPRAQVTGELPLQIPRHSTVCLPTRIIPSCPELMAVRVSAPGRLGAGILSVIHRASGLWRRMHYLVTFNVLMAHMSYLFQEKSLINWGQFHMQVGATLQGEIPLAALPSLSKRKTARCSLRGKSNACLKGNKFQERRRCDDLYKYSAVRFFFFGLRHFPQTGRNLIIFKCISKSWLSTNTKILSRITQN